MQVQRQIGRVPFTDRTASPIFITRRWTSASIRRATARKPPPAQTRCIMAKIDSKDQNRYIANAASMRCVLSVVTGLSAASPCSFP